jgi:anti-sigma B factor antagonist
MNIQYDNINGAHSFLIEGRIDTLTSPELESFMNEKINTEENSIFSVNMSKVDYISSAGLRVFLATLKALQAKGGTLTLKSLQPAVKEIFDMTGFTPLFQIQ